VAEHAASEIILLAARASAKNFVIPFISAIIAHKFKIVKTFMA
jgi:hypothetical protein